jgi:hypothetical protein
MTDSAKPAPRVLRRDNTQVNNEMRVQQEGDFGDETFSCQLSNGRIVTLREMNASDLLYLEKTLGNAGDMERSLKLAARLSTKEGRVTYEDLQRLRMKDLRLVTKLLGKAGETDEEDEDEFPND